MKEEIAKAKMVECTSSHDDSSHTPITPIHSFLQKNEAPRIIFSLLAPVVQW